MSKLKFPRAILFMLFIVPAALAEVLVTFQGDTSYNPGEEVAVDVYIQSSNASILLSTFEIFIEQNASLSLFKFANTIPADSYNELTTELNFNEPVSSAMWSMQDVADEPVTLGTVPVRIGSIRGKVLAEGLFSLDLSGTMDSEFVTGIWPMRVSYDYSSPQPLEITILPSGSECSEDSHCADDPDGNVCELTTGQCQCTLNTDCSSGQNCVQNICADLPACGDGIPNGDETCSSCPDDVGICPVIDTDLDGIDDREERVGCVHSDPALATYVALYLATTYSEASLLIREGPFIGCFRGDINLNGIINYQDVNQLIDEYALRDSYAPALPAEYLASDIAVSGTLNFQDINTFIDIYALR